MFAKHSSVPIQFLLLSLLLTILWQAAIAVPTSGQGVPRVTPQAPQPDGSIIHVVREGDTLFAVAIAYNVPVEQIQQLNSLKTNAFLIVGQRLLIRTAPPPVPTETPAPTEPPTATLSPTPALPTATPLLPVGPQSVLCVTAFIDTNSSHWRDPDEGPLEGVGVQLTRASGGVEAFHQMTNASGEGCFENLAPGRYQVSAVPPSNYALTTSGELMVEVQTGQRLDLSFGAVQGIQTAAAEVPTEEATSTPGKPDIPLGVAKLVIDNTGLIVMALAVVVLFGGLAVAIIAGRRR